MADSSAVERPKVAVVSDIDSRQPYGSFQRVTGIAEELQELCSTFLIGVQCTGIYRVQTFSLQTRSFLRYTARLAALIRRIRPDVVYAHRNLPGFSVSVLRSAGLIRRDVRVVFDFHSSAVLEYSSLAATPFSAPGSSRRIWKNERVEGYILSRGQPVIAASSELRSFLRDHYKSEAPMHVIPSGAPDEYFELPTAGHDPYPRSEQGTRALLVAPGGFLSNDLAVRMARDASEILSERSSDVRIYVVGGGREIEQGEHFCILGFVDDILSYVDHADVCLLPYPSSAVCGGARTKVLEFLARRKAVLSTDQGISGLSGLAEAQAVIVCPDSASAVADALEDFARDPSEYSSLGERGYTYASEHHRYSAIAEQVFGVLCPERAEG
jgi:glycosyltransferase involved in cell wall biosynthesis